MELWDETPTAAQAAVGVFVSGAITTAEPQRCIRPLVDVVAAKAATTASLVAKICRLLAELA